MTTEARRRLAEWLESVDMHPDPSIDDQFPVADLRALLESSSAPTGSVEPVAWRYQLQHPGGWAEWRYSDRSRSVEPAAVTGPFIKRVEPLYAAPPAQPAEGWVMVPKIGTRVAADHPVTCLNPTPQFLVAEIKYDSGFYVRGEETMWFSLSTLAAAPDSAQDGEER